MNSKSKPRSPPVFFLDHCLGSKVIAYALRRAGAKVEIHIDHFPQEAKDRDWLGEVGRRGWIVLTKDRRIRKRPPELVALLSSGVGAFVLTAADLKGSEMAEIFVKALPAINKIIERNHPPFIATVTRRGSVTMLSRGTTGR